MNASEKLQAVIKRRLEGEVFGWGPVLLVWAGVSAVRMLAEIAWGPTLVGGGLAALSAMTFQIFWASRVVAVRGWALQGLWFLLAFATWGLGSVAPSVGMLSPTAGAVLELVFLAGGLVQTGIMKSQIGLTLGGGALLGSAILLSIFPDLVGYRALTLALFLGLPAYLATRDDKHS